MRKQAAGMSHFLKKSNSDEDLERATQKKMIQNRKLTCTVSTSLAGQDLSRKTSSRDSGLPAASKPELPCMSASSFSVQDEKDTE